MASQWLNRFLLNNISVTLKSIIDSLLFLGALKAGTVYPHRPRSSSSILAAGAAWDDGRPSRKTGVARQGDIGWAAAAASGESPLGFGLTF